jgi:serine protease Do
MGAPSLIKHLAVPSFALASALAVTLTVTLAGCRTAPPRLESAPVPVSLPSALELAQRELKAGHPGKAWVLVSNQVETSPEKTAFLAEVRQALVQQRDDARGSHADPTARDLDATLAFIDGGVWNPAPAASLPIPPVTPPSQWLKGTATVVVNRGLKVENGSAQPDIVIGSGFFISSDGYLLTNHHVIESEVEPGTSTSSKLSIRLPGSKGERLPAKVIGWDRNLDVALLKAEYHPEYVFTFGTGPDPIPGQRLQALGSPGGLEATLTEGIVSAVQRPLLAVGEVLQIDVAVNPGNSGGPLVDSQGQVVGIVFAGIRDFQGVNFAIPTSLILKVLPRLQAGGRAVLAWAGLGFQEDLRGLEVVYVAPQGPGDWAGFKVGDRLTSVAGTPVTDLVGAQTRLLDFGTDAVVPFEVVRGGKPLKLWSTLAARPEFPLKDAALNDLTSRVMPLAFGVAVEDLASGGGDRSFRVTKVWAGTSAEELQLADNDPLEVLDWVADTKNEALITKWKVKRRLGGYLESTVQMGVAFSSRLFL